MARHIGAEVPYWIIAAGGKTDITIKWWATERWQAVVDHFRGRILFVQIGANGDHHPPLRSVLDLRGKTDVRQLVRLVHHSAGVLCPVTGVMHLAAAVPVREGRPPNRACVVVAGGREPAQWEAYPHHQFLHTLGALKCCDNGGCWKSRTVPLHDGDTARDKSLCVDVVHPAKLPRASQFKIQNSKLKIAPAPLHVPDHPCRRHPSHRALPRRRYVPAAPSRRVESRLTLPHHHSNHQMRPPVKKKKNKQTPKPSNLPALDSENWISESSNRNFLASARSQPADGSGSGGGGGGGTCESTSAPPASVTLQEQAVASGTGPIQDLGQTKYKSFTFKTKVFCDGKAGHWVRRVITATFQQEQFIQPSANEIIDDRIKLVDCQTLRAMGDSLKLSMERVAGGDSYTPENLIQAHEAVHKKINSEDMKTLYPKFVTDIEAINVKCDGNDFDADGVDLLGEVLAVAGEDSFVERAVGLN